MVNSLPTKFNRLAWSNLAAQSAEQIGLAAAPIVAVIALGAGAGETGWLQTAQTLPFLLLSIPAGIIVDRFMRARLMAGAEALRVVSLLCMLLFAVNGGLTLPLLMILGFLGACGTVVYSVAAPALVPHLVEPALLPAANSRIELARTTALAAGPALGGALVGWIGAAPAFSVAAMLSATAVILLAGLREPPRTSGQRKHPLHELRQGITFVFSHELLRPIFATQFVFNTSLFVLQAVYVPYAIHRLGLGAATVGLTLAAFGVGMVGGALIAPRLMRTFRFGVVVAIGPLAGMTAALLMMATIWLPSPLLASLSFFVMGAGPIVWVVSTTTLRQTVTPSGLLGRVSAIFTMAQGTRALGAAIGAIIGGLYGAETALVVAAAGFVAQAVLILLSPAVRVGRKAGAGMLALTPTRQPNGASR
jgi:predicted MFS family arabinose efflux permease